MYVSVAALTENRTFIYKPQFIFQILLNILNDWVFIKTLLFNQYTGTSIII